MKVFVSRQRTRNISPFGAAYRISVWNPRFRADHQAGSEAARSSRNHGPRSRREISPRSGEGAARACPRRGSVIARAVRSHLAARPRRPAWATNNPRDNWLHDDHTCLPAILAGRRRVTRSPEARSTEMPSPEAGDVRKGPSPDVRSPRPRPRARSTRGKERTSRGR